MEEELGLKFRFDAMINPCIDCSPRPLAVRLSPQEVVDFDMQDQKRMAELRKFNEKFYGSVHQPEHYDELYRCGGGIQSFGVDPYGILRICVLSPDGYDLGRGSFQEGWESFIFDLRSKKITR